MLTRRNYFLCAHLADIDAGVLLIVGPVAQRQAELLLAILPTQLHLLLHTNKTNVMLVRSLCFFFLSGADGFQNRII